MASIMSRRVFLKCAGAAALAVTASGIFAGCSEEGGGSKDTVYGVGESTQINGVNVKLLGYRLDPISGTMQEKRSSPCASGWKISRSRRSRWEIPRRPNWPRC